MKTLLKIGLFICVLNVSLISCTVEDEIITEDSLQTVSVDPHKKDANPPVETND